jgi:hypothetical protein
MQEAYRKDVERAFGVLQARYAIIKNSGCLWKESNIALIMKTAIILHNMTIEDEEGLEYPKYFDYHQLPHTQASASSNKSSSTHLDAFLLRYQKICDIHGHNRLKDDLI